MVLLALTNCGFTLRILITAFLVGLVFMAAIPPAFSERAIQPGVILTREVPLTIKIVLIGFDPHTIDEHYLTWRGNVAQTAVNNILSTGNVTGITYNLSYEFVYSTPELYLGLTKYLKSIQQKKIVYNPWFRATTQNYFYDADKVENWFVANNASYGGFPRNGYTFVFANLTNLPSVTEAQLNTENPMNATPHYYSSRFVDKDLEYQIRYRDFSIAWGGHNRLWFLDLSAGPEFWTWSSPEGVPHIPMQLAIDLYKLDVHESYGKQWLTQFLSDYIYDAVLNLAVPVFTYEPIYSQNYRVVVNVIDNRTEKERKQTPIEKTIQPNLIKQALTDLLPYSNVNVETRLMEAAELPGLQAAIVENTVTPPSDLAIPRYVDMRPIYRYLQEHLVDFVGLVRKDSTEFTVPVFAFAFQGAIYFGYTFKWYVATLKTEEGNFLGISLGDMALIGMNQNDFRRGDYVSPVQLGKGIGFTQVVIHEVGHSLGLMHPHQFGYVGDFESSAMSYWAWEYRFSQFDKDAINRAHADQLISQAFLALVATESNLAGRFDIGFAGSRASYSRSLIDKALERYGSMEYVQAVEIGRRALNAASDALAASTIAPGGIFTILVSFILGTVFGSTLIFLAFRRFAKER